MNLTSIIIPVYNEESTIYEVINAVLNINNMNNVEIIIVDDGSDDDTSNIIKKFLHLNNVLYINHKKNLGKGAAINNGIQKSSGARAQEASLLEGRYFTI